MFLVKKRSTDAQYLITNSMFISTEAAVRKCSSKWVFLKILQYLQEKTCVEFSF